MFQVLHLANALVRKSRLLQRLPHTQRTAPSPSKISFHTTGKIAAKHEVCCCSSQGQHTNVINHSHQGQHAHVMQEGPDISNLDTALQHQWNHAANAQLGIIVIKPYSHKAVWWTCDQCPDGHPHSWSACVAGRTNGSGCPQCIGRQVCKHNSLATKAPLVAAQWDYEANDGTPEDLVAQSHRVVKWHCNVCGCNWEATPNARVSKCKAGCPQCADDAKTKKRTKQPTFAECNHRLLAEWDHKRNAAQGYFSDKIRLKSKKPIFWLCTKCSAGQEHSWSARPYNRTGRTKTGCPVCAGMAACRCNSLQALYPVIAAEWDYSRNEGQPCDYTASCDYLAWWSSPQRGSWQQTVHSRTSGQRQQGARLRHSIQREASRALLKLQLQQ
ncbi:hypothetical protein ABBQ32_013221 [Trebouxia sp. C0010 RCD-2024]